MEKKMPLEDLINELDINFPDIPDEGQLYEIMPELLSLLKEGGIETVKQIEELPSRDVMGKLWEVVRKRNNVSETISAMLWHQQLWEDFRLLCMCYMDTKQNDI